MSRVHELFVIVTSVNHFFCNIQSDSKRWTQFRTSVTVQFSPSLLIILYKITGKDHNSQTKHFFFKFLKYISNNMGYMFMTRYESKHVAHIVTLF